MVKIIKKITVDYDDSMTVFNLIEELNELLVDYNLSIEIEDAQHDGYDVVILSEIN